MEQKIKISKKEDFLVFEIEGQDSYEFSLEYWKKVGEECRTQNFSKALIIEDLVGPVSTIEAFKIAETLPKLLKGIQVAFVDRQEADFRDNQFGETVVQNRGGYLKVFPDIDSAEKWLAE